MSVSVKHNPANIFCPPMTAAAVERGVYSSTVSRKVPQVAPEKILQVTEAVPWTYMDSSERFVLGRSDTSQVYGEGGNAVGGTEKEFVDRYSTPLWIDNNSHAMRSQYEKSKQREQQMDAGKRQIYRRQEQLRAGEMSYYPGRDEWLVQWQRARTYGLPKPQQHDDYCMFVSGRRNEEWVTAEKQQKNQGRIEDNKAMR
ncbi:hypothetical protein TrRE_jg8744 [Triparma retinervis]|uniref:Uncharacterized protein n=1 Tax=Triparma retinervis TaxID=2557542 RepID=A0A9W7A8A0_9STRA|nr:hypothetical protein TrRE_jg8744 [Triparma retinervis]